ncbi:MAG: hypothetical protein JWN41_1553 [Thermoleophilia bacterium]|nr:hypothetical protein [Thermoleophilia bacterium]
MSKSHAALPARFHEAISVTVHVTDQHAYVEWRGEGWAYHATAQRGRDGEITSYNATGTTSDARPLAPDLRERVSLVLALLPTRVLQGHPIGSGSREWSEDFCVADLL